MAQQTRAVATQAYGIAPDPYSDLAPFVATAKNPWDPAKAAHLMRRAGLGASPEEIPTIVQQGMHASVDKLLAVTTSGLQETGQIRLPNGELLRLSSRSFGATHQWLHELATTKQPLKEKMALFWSDHFSVGTKDRRHEALLVRHINVFRKHGLGRFHDLLVAVTRDPAMLWWLDNNVNGQPEHGRPKINENYGRELLELYTLGVNAGYTQKDVREAAKCLTGWSTGAIDQFAYKPAWHVPGRKSFLGTTILSNGQREVHDLLDTILGHPAAARFLVTKIWKYFVSETPYPQLIEVLADKWRKSGYDIKFLMSTIFRSNYFYSSRSIKTLVKNPVEVYAQATRALHVKWRFYLYADRGLAAMGYRLMDYSDPSGYRDGIAWIDEMAIIARANFANDATQMGFKATFDPNREISRLNLSTAKAIVDHYLRVLGVDNVPANTRSVLYLFMDLVDTGRQKFTLTPAKINEKVRGLVHLALSLPEYSIN